MLEESRRKLVDHGAGYGGGIAVPPPLRAARMNFAKYRSSLSNAISGTRFR